MSKPGELLKQRLQARAERNLSGKKRPSPSQKKSESLHKKLNRGKQVPQAIRYDCNRCPKEPCGQTIDTCGLPRRPAKCRQCGLTYTYRFDLENIFEYCTPCRISLEREKNANN